MDVASFPSSISLVVEISGPQDNRLCSYRLCGAAAVYTVAILRTSHTPKPIWQGIPAVRRGNSVVNIDGSVVLLLPTA